MMTKADGKPSAFAWGLGCHQQAHFSDLPRGKNRENAEKYILFHCLLLLLWRHTRPSTGTLSGPAAGDREPPFPIVLHGGYRPGFMQVGKHRDHRRVKEPHPPAMGVPPHVKLRAKSHGPG